MNCELLYLSMWQREREWESKRIWVKKKERVKELVILKMLKCIWVKCVLSMSQLEEIISNIKESIDRT